MTVCLTVSELAELFLEQMKPYGERDIRETAEFVRQLDIYIKNHPQLIEAFPDVQCRRANVLLTIRSIARRILIERKGVKRESDEQIEELINRL